MTGPSLRVVLLGSTGSIGTQTLDVIERLRRQGRSIRVVGLAAGQQVRLLSEQARAFRPEALAIASTRDVAALDRAHPETTVLSGSGGLRALAGWPDVDLVVNALVGAAGLPATIEALQEGRVVALANKESLVVGGELVREILAHHGGRLIPIDSEHCGLLQGLDAGRREDVAAVTLTASGGPFLRTPIDALARVTPDQALAHPNWSMGPRITIDSATMVNKAFEIIEAHHLFDLPFDRIDAVIHPQSLVHAWVTFADGSTIAQVAPHDMRIPIQYALTYPERVDTGLPSLDLRRADWTFEPIEPARFPAMETVLEAGRLGGTAPAAINAADEILVARFLREDIPFSAIASGLSHVLDVWKRAPTMGEVSLDALHSADRHARQVAQSFDPTT